MSMEYKLPFTAKEIEEKLNKVEEPSGLLFIGASSVNAHADEDNIIYDDMFTANKDYVYEGTEGYCPFWAAIINMINHGAKFMQFIVYDDSAATGDLLSLIPVSLNSNYPQGNEILASGAYNANSPDDIIQDNDAILASSYKLTENVFEGIRQMLYKYTYGSYVQTTYLIVKAYK